MSDVTDAPHRPTYGHASVAVPHVPSVPVPPRRPSRDLGRMRYPAISVASVATLLAIWAVGTNVFHTSPMVMPSPQVMANHVRDLLAEGYAGKPLWEHIVASLLRI